jgi:hypothetical protein
MLSFYDDQQSFETVRRMSPLWWVDDFVGAGSVTIPAAGSAESGVAWVSKIVGAAPPTVAGIANGAGGQIACTLTSASQKQDAALYQGDQFNFDVTKGLVFEARIRLSVLPSVAGVQAVWGLSSAWIDGPDNASDYLEFGASGNGAILLRSQDGTTQNSIASGTTVLATDWHIYRIECFDLTDIRYYIDGGRVSANNAVAFAASGAAATLQPYLSVYKASGAGVATLLVDYIKLGVARA